MNSDSVQFQCDVLVAGGGPTGMAACLKVAEAGYNVIFVAPSVSHVTDDKRTTALMMPGINMLEEMGLWSDLKDKSAALSTMRIVDGTDRLIRAPTVNFHASEIDEQAFGYNIKNADLNATLSEALGRESRIEQIDGMLSAVAFDSDGFKATLSDGRIVAGKLIVGADGTESVVRKAAEIDVRKWRYPQTAVVLTFSHTRPHRNCSTEIHIETGACTQVPLPGDESSLVWMVGPEQAETLKALDDDALALAIEKRMASMLGKVTLTSRPQLWPLSGLVAHRFAAERAALIGQTAHAFPPVGAQGLNLGLRDVRDLAIALGEADGDPGRNSVTRKYDRLRKADVWMRTGAVDAFNRSLLTDFLPVQALRAVGLGALHHLAPLRGVFMREGMSPGSGWRHLVTSSF